VHSIFSSPSVPLRLYPTAMGGPCTVDGQVRDELDNFFACRIVLDGLVWPSSEHYYQACKFPGDAGHREAVRKAPSGMDCFKVGHQNRAGLRSDWEEVKVDVMYRANLAKFSQDARLRVLLTTSRGPIEAQGNPGGWRTWNEVLLERIREELRDDSLRDQNLLQQRIDAMVAYRGAAKASDQYGMKVIAQYAAKRWPVPDLKGGQEGRLLITGVGQHLDGVYQRDLLMPSVNGRPHYFRRQGGHLCLGVKGCRQAWVLDEDLSAGEATGAAFFDNAHGADLPTGDCMWQCYDEGLLRHVERSVSVRWDQ